MKPTIIPLRMDGRGFLHRVRELAGDSANIVFTLHAEQRMVLRHFTFLDVQNVLLRGRLIEGPFRNNRGNWQGTLYRQIAGQEQQVVAALEEGVVVITVI